MRVQVEVWLHKDARTPVATCETPLLHLEQAQGTFWVPKAGCEWHVDTIMIKTPSFLGWISSAQLDHLAICVPSISISSSFYSLVNLSRRKNMYNLKDPSTGPWGTSACWPRLFLPSIELQQNFLSASCRGKQTLTLCNERVNNKSAIWWWTLDAQVRVISDPWQIFIIFGILYHVYRSYRDIYDNTV